MAERRVPIGWRCCTPRGALAFLPPVLLGAAEAEAAGCAHLAGRLIVVRASYDLRISVTPAGIRPVRFLRAEEPGALSETAFQGLVSAILPEAQREPRVPAVQISLNLQMVCDAPCNLMLMPPFVAPEFRDWPGSLVCGRFPLRSWPRALNAVLEWHDRGRDWVIRRGRPIACLLPDFADPQAVPELVEAATTPAFLRHSAGIDSVIAYGRNVAPMFAQAEARRPARLLERRRTGCPDWGPPPGRAG